MSALIMVLISYYNFYYEINIIINNYVEDDYNFVTKSISYVIKNYVEDDDYNYTKNNKC